MPAAIISPCTVRVSLMWEQGRANALLGWEEATVSLHTICSRDAVAPNMMLFEVIYEAAPSSAQVGFGMTYSEAARCGTIK